jgi:hypothetical protein
MGYYVRVLSTSADCVPLAELQSALENENLQATICGDESDPDDDWTQVILKHADGREIASIERNPVDDESLGAEELEEFTEDIAECKPSTAVQWLLDYFPRVRCIYAFQVLRGTDHKNGWDILEAIKNQIWAFAPSILQADAEGFSNEDGYHILWQFSDSVKGTWWMGVLRDGRWVHFQMELGNPSHREAFLNGNVPKGVSLPD